MIWRQGTIIGVTMLVAVIVQNTLLSRLGLPGATPDLAVVSVVAVSLAMGPTQGAAAGFLAGLLVDLAPPADTLLGVNALVYLVIGFVVGVAVDPRDRTVPLMIGIAGIAAAAATLGTAALDSLLGSSKVQWDAMPVMILTSALYAVILAPPVLLGMSRLSRRFATDRSTTMG